MHTNGQPFWNNRPAPAAYLSGVRRVHGNNLNTSFFRFVFKHLPEPSKTGVIRGEGKASVTVHKAESKVLDRNHVMGSNEATADFVKIIRPLVGNMLMQACNLPIGVLLAIAPFDLPGSATGKTSQLRQVSSQPARVLNQFARRESGETFQANVNADLSAGRGALRYRCGQVKHQADIPTVIELLDNDVLDLRFGGKYPVITHSQFAYILDVEAPLPMFILTQLASVAVGILDAFEAVAAFEARKTRFLSRLQAAEESGKGFVQAAKKLLQTGSIQHPEGMRVVAAQVLEVLALCSIANSFARFLVDRYPLFEGSIVTQPGLPEQEVQFFELLNIWPKEILVRTKQWLPQFLYFDVTLEQRAQFFRNLVNQHFAPIFWTPHKVILQKENAAGVVLIPCVAHRTNVLLYLMFVNYLTQAKEKSAFSVA